jgi:hypothetical protein
MPEYTIVSVALETIWEEQIGVEFEGTSFKIYVLNRSAYWLDLYSHHITPVIIYEHITSE